MLPGDSADTARKRFERRLIDLYAAEPDLHALPREVFACIEAAADCEIAGFSGSHVRQVFEKLGAALAVHRRAPAAGRAVRGSQR